MQPCSAPKLPPGANGRGATISVEEGVRQWSAARTSNPGGAVRRPQVGSTPILLRHPTVDERLTTSDCVHRIHDSTALVFRLASRRVRRSRVAAIAGTWAQAWVSADNFNDKDTTSIVGSWSGCHQGTWLLLGRRWPLLARRAGRYTSLDLSFHPSSPPALPT